ncbi:MAG: AtpZ/AtpI family protein [Myxococcota bacterium]|nr:AtpZ/AtpI family protein [Myxococcota bacterium]
MLEAVLSIPAGALLGYALDAWLGTGPVLVLVGLGLGFAAFVAGAVRLMRRLEQDPEDAKPPGDR